MPKGYCISNQSDHSGYDLIFRTEIVVLRFTFYSMVNQNI